MMYSNIGLSFCETVPLKGEFIVVAAFERPLWDIQKSPFLHVLAFICRSYLQKCNTFKVGCNTLKKSSTFKGKFVVNSENFICNL